MKTNGKHIRLFEPSGCLSKDGLFGYLSHNLNATDRHAVETHVSECLFCSDALEGYEKQAVINKVSAEFSELKSGIKFRLGSNASTDFKKKDNKRYMIFAVSIAAMFTVLISGFYLFKILPTNDKQKEMALQNPGFKNDIPATKPLEEDNTKNLLKEDSAITDEKVVVNQQSEHLKQAVPSGKETLSVAGKNYWSNKYSEDQSVVDGEIIDGISANGKGEKVQTIALGGSIANEREKSEKGIMVTTKTESTGDADNMNGDLEQKAVVKINDDKKVAKAEADEGGEYAKDMVTEESIKVSNKKSPKKATQNAPVTTGYASDLRVAKATPTLNDAIADYNAGNYSKALTEFEYLLTQDKNNYAALYYSAICQYKSGQKEAAIAQLDKLIKKKNNPFYEMAMWQKAQIAEESADKKQAVEIYREIIKINGSMKQNAIKKADELDK